MIRLTTPTHTFVFPANINPAELDWMMLTYAQNGTILFEKELSDVTIVGQTISVVLSQEETKLFSAQSPNNNVQVQMRVGIGETAMATKIFNVPVADVLNSDVLPAPEPEEPEE